MRTCLFDPRVGDFLFQMASSLTRPATAGAMRPTISQSELSLPPAKAATLRRPGSANPAGRTSAGCGSTPAHRAPPPPLLQEEAAAAQRKVETLVYELSDRDMRLRAAQDDTSTLAQTLSTTDKVLHEVVHRERMNRRKIAGALEAQRIAQAKLRACEEELRALKLQHDVLRRRGVHGRTMAILDARPQQKAALEQALEAGLRSAAIAQAADPVRFLGAYLLAYPSAAVSAVSVASSPRPREPRPHGGGKGRKCWTLPTDLFGVSDEAEEAARPKAPAKCPRPLGVAIRCAARGVEYRLTPVHGWACWVAPPCLAKYPALRMQLSFDLAELGRVLPTTALSELQASTAIWINEEPPAYSAPPGLVFHHGSAALVRAGELAEKGDSIEIGSCAAFLDWHAEQPAMLLHACAHAFERLHRAKLAPILDQAYKECLGSGKYDAGPSRRSTGTQRGARRAPPPLPAEVAGRGGAVAEDEAATAAHDASEFFAEMSEAFFSSRVLHADKCPHVHDELLSFDPVAYELCEAAWGVRGAALPTRHEVPATWLELTAKVPRETLRGTLLAADQLGDGSLERVDLERQLVVGVPGLRLPEARALAALAAHVSERKFDGRFDVRAFVAWLSSHHGSFDLEEIPLTR